MIEAILVFCTVIFFGTIAIFISLNIIESIYTYFNEDSRL